MGYQRRQTENPANRFEALKVEYEPGLERPQGLKVYRENAKSILSRNDSPDLPFKWSVNPYRGCAHACAYCYARPYHEYLGFGAGTDFDTQIIAKGNAPVLLRRELSKAGWAGDPVAFSGVTDCYQPVESSLQLTRSCLEVCADLGNAAGVITKSPLVLRDIDVLQHISRRGGGNVVLSIPIGDGEMARKIEPFVASPDQRFAAMEKVAKAGLRVGLSIGPVIPGLTDSHIPKLLERAAKAGASFAFYTLLRLPGSVKDVFLARLRGVLPDQAGKVEHHLRSMRAGELYQTEFGQRMRGQGPMADFIEALFLQTATRLGLAPGERRMELPQALGDHSERKRPSGPEKIQMDLFG